MIVVFLNRVRANQSRNEKSACLRVTEKMSCLFFQRSRASIATLNWFSNNFFSLICLFRCGADDVHDVASFATIARLLTKIDRYDA